MSQKIKQLTIKRSIHSVNKQGELNTNEAEVIMVRTFDENENKTSETTYSSEEKEEETSYVYENNVCVAETTHHCFDGFTESTLNTYNADKQIIKQIKKYEYGDEIINFYYDGKNLIKKEVCDEDGEIESIEQLEYVGDVISNYKHFSPTETLLVSREIKIVNGAPIEEKQWNVETGKTLTIKYSNWQKDLEPSFSVYNEDDKLIERHLRKYNEHNLLVEDVSETTVHGYSMLTTQYSYDENNNLLHSETSNANGDIVKNLQNVYVNNRLVESTHIEVSPTDKSVQHFTDFFEYEIWQ